MHLGDDDALGAIDDKCAVFGHQGHIAHIDVLFLDILDRTGTGIFINFKHDQPQGNLQRCRKRHIALLAFFHIILGLVEFVGYILERSNIGKITDRQNRIKNRLKPLIEPATFRYFHLQKFIIGKFLNLDEVWHHCRSSNFSKILANAFATKK